MSARRLLLWLGLALVGGLAAYFWSAPAPAPVAEAAAPAPREEPAHPAPADPPAPAAQADAAPANPRFFGYCPTHEQPSRPYNRPTLAAYLNEQDRVFRQRLDRSLAASGASATLVHGSELLREPERFEEAYSLLAQAPDRRDGDFDLAARSLVRAAAQQLERSPRTARELARRAASDAPRDPVPAAMEAVASLRLSESADAREALRRARALAPTEPAINWSLASTLKDTLQLTEASEALEAYARAEPGDVAAAQLLARIGVQLEIQKGYLERERDGITLAADPHTLDPANADALLVEVSRDLDDAARLTGTPRRRELVVVVYPGREELLAVACVNAWTGALFDGVLRIVGTGKGRDPVPHAQVRHESMHAQLGPNLPPVPFWFHEGLATLFAEPNRADLAAAQRTLLRNRTCIPFGSLEGSFWDFVDDGDARLAYAQSLAMARLLEARGGADAMARAARHLSEGKPPSALLEHIIGHPVGCDDLLALLAESPPEPAPR